MKKTEQSVLENSKIVFILFNKSVRVGNISYDHYKDGSPFSLEKVSGGFLFTPHKFPEKVTFVPDTNINYIQFKVSE